MDNDLLRTKLDPSRDISVGYDELAYGSEDLKELNYIIAAARAMGVR